MKAKQSSLWGLVAFLGTVGCAAPPTAESPEGERPSSESRALSPGGIANEKQKEGASSAQVPSTEHSATASREDKRGEDATLELEPLPKNTKVLHVGDSFAGALGLPLGKLFEEAEVRSVLKHTDASYLTDWAWNGELQKMIWRYNPDLVLITLGGNELEIVEPKKRERTVKKIVSTLEGRPCVWVGVPLWKGPQNGLMDVIERSCEPCLFLDTSQLIDLDSMGRLPDGIHPTKAARKEWAESVYRWLEEHRNSDGEKPWSMTME